MFSHHFLSYNTVSIELIVLVSWAALTKIPEIGWLKQQIFNSHSSEAEKSSIRVRVLADPVSGGHCREGEGASCLLSLLIRALIPS